MDTSKSSRFSHAQKIPASAHLPRRRVNTASPSRSKPPGKLPLPPSKKYSPRRARFKSTLPTIEEGDARSELVNESVDINGNEESSMDVNQRRKTVGNTRRAVTSIFEKRPTRSNLTLPPPIRNSSFMRIGDEEVLIAQRRPFVVYDLLPPKAKSPSYLLRLDTDIPRPRFILTHRTYYQKYNELSAVDRQELVYTAVDFASIMELPDCSVIVPLGNNSKCDTLFNTFYAYINVPSICHFMKAYEKVKQNVPIWPSIRWVTSYWKTNSEDVSVEKSYLQTVRDYHHRWNNVEIPHLEFKDCLIQRPKRRLSRDSIIMECPKAPDNIVICNKNNRIGFVLNDDVYRVQPAVRWHFLELMAKYARQYVSNSQNGCYMFLSLGEKYLLPKDKVYAFLQFSEELQITS